MIRSATGRVGRRPVEDEQRFVIHNVSWEQYEAILAALGDRGVPKLTYLRGMLELMSPGRQHESEKVLIARLVWVYADECDIDLSGYGGMTFRKKASERGVEPDECYSLGAMPEGEDERPDIALEVIVTHGSIDKLDVYRGLDVPEVWFFEDGAFSLHRLGPKGYRKVERSTFLPGLDFAALASFVNLRKSQPAIVRAFRDHLRAEKR